MLMLVRLLDEAKRELAETKERLSRYESGREQEKLPFHQSISEDDAEGVELSANRHSEKGEESEISQ